MLQDERAEQKGQLAFLKSLSGGGKLVPMTTVHRDRERAYHSRQTISKTQRRRDMHSAT